jgi:serine/threonine protein phosphatase 1
VALLGNHEEMLLNALESRSEFKYWQKLGGEQTLRSYSPAIRPGTEVIPNEHVRFIRTFQPYLETTDFIFVHASYDPNLPMARQTDRTLRWASVTPERMVPHVSGKVVIAGHTPQQNGEVRDHGHFKLIDTAAYANGWLTALEVYTGDIIQANQQGQLRRPGGNPA